MEDAEQDDMPPIYDIRFMPSELTEIFKNILGKASTENVASALGDYLRANIEPVGWKAIWRPAFLSDISLLVYVNDVDCDNLEASIIVKDLVYPKANMLGPEETQQVSSMIDNQEPQTAPLYDIQVVSCEDYDIDYYKTAYLVEMIRFFYKHIWMPWDDLEKENSTVRGDFVTTKLLPRMNLICEMKNGDVSSTLIKRYNAVIEDAFATKQKFDQLNNRAIAQHTIELNESTSNLKGDELNTVTDFISDIDAIECVRNRMKLEDYEREIKLLEDSHLRTVYHTLRPGFEDQPEGPTVHLVAEHFNFCSLSSIMMQLTNILKANDERAQWPIRLHLNLHKALSLANSGDVIYLAPGTYTQSLSWIEKDLELYGLPGGPVELVSHDKSGDIFLFFDIPHEVKLSNVTLRVGGHSLNHLVVVKSGRLVLERCTIDCRNLTRKPVIRLNTASVENISTSFLNAHHLGLSS